MKRTIKLALAAWPLMTLAVTAMCFFTGLLASWFGIELPPQPSLDAVLNAKGWRLLANIVIISLGAPIFEEAIFRGLFYRLPSRWINEKVMTIVSAVLFSAAHYIQMPFPDNAFLALFLFGLIQCKLYKKSNSILSVMITHSLFNTTNLILLFLFPEVAKIS